MPTTPLDRRIGQKSNCQSLPQGLDPVEFGLINCLRYLRQGWESTVFVEAIVLWF